VLDFWHDYCKILPELATLARDIFCLPAKLGSYENFLRMAENISNPIQTLFDFVPQKP
jgi:hypothetical protein